MLLTRHLTGAGYQLKSERVDTAEAMRTALEADEWDVILCDYSMPHFDAPRALGVRNELEIDTPLIIISGTVGEAVAVEAMRAGAQDYLMKDNLVRLVPTIERELIAEENRRQQRQAENERRIIFEIIQGAVAAPNLDEFLKLVHCSISQVIYAENFFVMLHDALTDMIRFEFWVDKRDPSPAPKPLGTGFASYVLRTGEPLLLTKELKQKLKKEGKAKHIGSVSASWLGVPLRTPQRTIGVLVLQHYDDENAYSESDLEFLSSAGDQLALAIERKRAEEKLLRSEEIYRDLVENAHDIIYSHDLEGNFTSINEAAEQITGYKREETLKMNLAQIVVPEQLERALEMVARKLKGEKMTAYTFEILAKDGRVITIEINSKLVLHAGVPVGIQGIARDVTERKQADQAIRQALATLDATEDCAFIFDPETLRFSYVNQGSIRQFGYTRAELLTMTPLDIKPEINEARFREMLRPLLRGEVRSHQFTTLHRHKDGHDVPVEINLQYVVPAGERPRFIAIARDITERKRAEEELREANERAILDYEQLIERIASLALVLGHARELKVIFEAVREFASVSAPTNGMFITLFDPERGVRSAAYAWSEGHEIDISALPPMEMTGSPHSRAVAEDKIIVTDDFQSAMKGKPIVNVGLEIDPRLPQSSLVVPMSVMGRVVGGVEIQSLDLNAYTMSHATAMQMAANLAANALDNVRLIDAERSQAEQLRQAQKLESVGRLAGGIAHDFNNMLTAINGYSDLTLRKLSQDDPMRHNIEEIKKAGERSALLTNQLLAFSRKQILHPEMIRINEVINETSNMLKRLIGEDVELVTVLSPTVGSIKFDPGQLSQIIVNLAVNARDAMPDGGKLTIETTNVFIDPDYTTKRVEVLPGAYVSLSISDTGTGMPPEIQEQIFEPFFTTKEIGTGTGLGLATVYGIVKQSGGSIFVYSEVEHGTTFKILLPRVADEAEARDNRDVAPAKFALGTETILLVEDEEIVRTLSLQILKECGYKVIVARDGIEALEIFEKTDERIDLLLTDVVMPRMGGRELAEKLLAEMPDLPILFASGYTDDAIVRHGVLETNVNFIQKPFTLDDVARKVRDLLDLK